MRTVSVSTALFDGYPMELAIDEIAAAGIRSVEPAYIRGYVDFDETAFADEKAVLLRNRIGAAGLRVTAISAHMNLGAENASNMLAARLRFAAGLGARFLITNTGAKADRDRIMAGLEHALPLCEELGVMIALENPGHGAGDLIGDGADGATLISALGSPWIALNYDAGNIFTYSREEVVPENDIAKALPYIAHLHLKDVARDEDGWRFTAIGDGAIDYRMLWRQLPRDLPVGIELPLRLERPGRADPVRRAGLTPLEDIRRALIRSFNYVKRLGVQSRHLVD